MLRHRQSGHAQQRLRVHAQVKEKCPNPDKCKVCMLKHRQSGHAQAKAKCACSGRHSGHAQAKAKCARSGRQSGLPKQRLSVHAQEGKVAMPRQSVHAQEGKVAMPKQRLVCMLRKAKRSSPGKFQVCMLD